MRVAPHVFRPEAHEAKQLDDAVGPLLRVADAVDEQRLADDVEQRHPRVERRERILEDHLHLAPQEPQLALRDRRHVEDLALGPKAEPDRPSA